MAESAGSHGTENLQSENTDHVDKNSSTVKESESASENEVDGGQQTNDKPTDANENPEKDEEKESMRKSKDSTDKHDSVINNQETHAGSGDQEDHSSTKESDPASENEVDGGHDKPDAKKGHENDEYLESTTKSNASQPEMAVKTPSEDDHMQSDAASEKEVDAEPTDAEPTDAKKVPENYGKMESTQESKDSTDKPDSVIDNPETETHVGDQEDHSSTTEVIKESDPASENKVDGESDHDEPTDTKISPESTTHKSKDSTVKHDSVINNPETHAGDQGNKRLWLLAGLIVLVAASLHAFSSQSPPGQKEDRRVDVFLRELERIQSKFPTQRPELWRRGRIHLKRHLQMERPTEPVSLILTAGLKAEKTLHCLAQGLASAFSSALNASVLHIDGASKAHLDSDQVKLDIDSQLRGAFEGDKPVAVINRFEELPPASTLIFYRYCDHENAAYKTTSLIFTVLLAGEEELSTHLSLSAVEEMVDDHLKRKFLSAGRRITFDRMDLDKYSGLWSRISHLILPVSSEETMEPEGCQET